LPLPELKLLLPDGLEEWLPPLLPPPPELCGELLWLLLLKL
jgi:hypothetical protein